MLRPCKPLSELPALAPHRPSSQQGLPRTSMQCCAHALLDCKGTPMLNILDAIAETAALKGAI